MNYKKLFNDLKNNVIVLNDKNEIELLNYDNFDKYKKYIIFS